jgi:hypothetical protein
MIAPSNPARQALPKLVQHARLSDDQTGDSGKCGVSLRKYQEDASPAAVKYVT